VFGGLFLRISEKSRYHGKQKQLSTSHVNWKYISSKYRRCKFFKEPFLWHSEYDGYGVEPAFYGYVEGLNRTNDFKRWLYCYMPPKIERDSSILVTVLAWFTYLCKKFVT